jgi:esterase/lipase
MEGTDVNSTAIESMQRMGQSPGGQMAWMISKVIVTLIVTGAAAMGTSYIKDMRDDIRNVSNLANSQDKTQALTTQKIDNLSKVSDATVATLQALSMQVQHNTYDIQTQKEREAESIARSRPTP